MSTHNTEKKKFKEKLKDTYRLVIIDVEDLKEVGKYQLSMGQIYTYLALTALVFTGLVVSIIFFSPVKRLVPGYGDIEENSKFIVLRKKITELEKELETQVVYTKGLQNMLSGQKIEDLELPDDIASNEGNSEVAKVVTDADLEESRITRNLDNQYFVTPVIGSISAAYNRSTDHLGVDILAPKDSAIKAIAAGVVVGSDFTLDTGNTISIQHQNNIISVYKHNSALLKKAGDMVAAGEAIAIIGNTGTLTDGPHLHFELWYNGNPVNPENFISFK